MSDDLGFFAVQPEVRSRLSEVAASLERAGAVVSYLNLGWTRAIADGWVRHWHVYLAAFIGDALDKIGPLADPRLSAVIARGRTYDAVSIKELDVLRKQQWDVLSELFRNYDVLLSPTMTRPAVCADEDDARYHLVTPDGRKHGLDMTSIFNWCPGARRSAYPRAFPLTTCRSEFTLRPPHNGRTLQSASPLRLK